MGTIKIAFINASTVVSDNDAKAVMSALQKQVSNDFAPVWGVDAILQFFKQGQATPTGYWWLTILDNSDQAGALGYHDITNEGLPLGKIFAKSDLQYGSAWSVTMNSLKCWEILISISPSSGKIQMIRAYSTLTRCVMLVKPMNLPIRSTMFLFPILCTQVGLKILYTMAYNTII